MKRVSYLVPYLVLFAGFALRLYRLGVNSLWYDETVSMLLARAEIPELLRHTAGDIHPPLYYLLLNLWGRLAGWSEFSAAFLSLWFGVLLIALVYRVAREWVRVRPAATLAALLIAVSPYNVWYSQEVRMYTVGAVLGLLSVYFLRRMLSRDKIFSSDFFAYAIFTALGLYTLYYFVFLLVFQWIWVGVRILQSENRIVSPRETTRITNFAVSQLAVILLYLPWLPVAFRQATDPPVPPWRELVALPLVLAETWSALTLGQAVDPLLFAPFTLLLLIPIGALLWHDRKLQTGIRDPKFQNAVSAWFLFCYTFIPLAVIYLFSLWKPLYHVRYMFTYSPAFYLLAAWALVFTAQSFRRWFRARRDLLPKVTGALAVLAILGFVALTGFSLYNFWFNPQYTEDDLRGAVSTIAERWRPGDVILVNAGYAYPAFAYYFPDPFKRERLTNYASNPPTDEPVLLMTGSIGGAKNLGWGDPLSDFYATTADETNAALDRVLAEHPRVWMLRIYDTVTDPNGDIRNYLNTHATLFEDRAFGGESQARVQGFMTRPASELPPGATRINQNLGERVELAGYETGSGQVERGGYFDAVLYWKLRQVVNINYQVTLQLLNAQGENVAQTDETPLGELLPMTRWEVTPENGAGVLYREPLRLKVPAALPPGVYRAILKLYNPRSGEVLGGPVELGALEVRGD